MNSVSNAESARNIGYDNSDSGLTATDVQGAVDEVTDKMGNMRMTKLWENPSPSSAFAAQDINESIADYSFVMILAKWNKDDNAVQAFWGRVGSGIIVISFGLASASGSRTMQRYATISDTTKIVFNDAVDAVGTTASSTNNNRCIPIAIYGIKLT